MNSVTSYTPRLVRHAGPVGGSLLTPEAPAAAAAAAPVQAAASPAMDALRLQFLRLSQYTQLLQLKLQLVSLQSQINGLIGQLPAAPAPKPPAAPKPEPAKPAPRPAPAPKPNKPETSKPAPAKPEKPKPAPKPEKPKPQGSGPLLKKGLAGSPVKELQQRLRHMGYDPGPADGLFGDKTLAAVKKFQKKHGLASDGIVGPKTWDQLGIKVKGKTRRMADMGVKTPDGLMVRRQGKLISKKIAGNFDRMVAAAKRDGVNLVINNSYRSYAEQVVLWNQLGRDPKRVAPPGTSNHQTGVAIDFVSTPGAWAWLKAHASSFGLRNYPPEPWHYSPTGNGVGASNGGVPQLATIPVGL